MTGLSADGQRAQRAQLVVGIGIQLLAPVIILIVVPTAFDVYAENALALPLHTQVVLNVAAWPVLMFLPAITISVALVQVRRHRPALLQKAVAVSVFLVAICLLYAAVGLSLPLAQL